MNNEVSGTGGWSGQTHGPGKIPENGTNQEKAAGPVSVRRSRGTKPLIQGEVPWTRGVPNPFDGQNCDLFWEGDGYNHLTVKEKWALKTGKASNCTEGLRGKPRRRNFGRTLSYRLKKGKHKQKESRSQRRSELKDGRHF